MKKILVEFEYDPEKLGRGWFNIGNLEAMLYGRAFTRRELLKVRVIKKHKGSNYG